ncbi:MULTISPECIES: SMU1112c/YaeR family gloxylase I-like metalloprotein [Aquitalea]|uniref:Glyoxylase I family protein n=1 Tax=Aquitalea magnusonii TaxID=332411 RepID=A0A318JJL5_9NEIS|nr:MULTISPECIES: VOC family protein [Aquitalea]PXX51222.1 glyoxylase I family protein [Aquitalea magnusonii]
MPDSPLPLRGLHHVALITADYPRARDFYHRILGLPIISESWRAERQSWKLNLQLPDGSQLELFSFPAAPPRLSRPEACGLRHLALSTDDVEGVRALLLRQQVACEEIRLDELTGQRFFFCQDPDQLPIEFYEIASG